MTTTIEAKPPELSKRELFKKLPKEVQKKRLMALSNDEAEMLYHDWDWWARPSQRTPEGAWGNWLVLAGRGFGKTRVGSEWVLEQKRKGYRYVNLIGATKQDAIDIMVNGESGILNCANKWERPVLKNEQLHWPDGSISLIFSAMEPARLRGPQHEKLWCDEMAAWRYPEAWDMANFGLRLGDNPQALITTTPRPTELIKDLAKSPTTFVTSGSTYDNKANLAPKFITEVLGKFEGTRLGRQEIYAELLEDNENALWTHKLIDKYRVPLLDENGKMIDYHFSRIVVAIDPATTANENSDLTGIIVAGQAQDGHYYVIEDLSLLAKPNEWCTVAINAYYKYSADRIVAETNNGGDMIEGLLRNIDPNVAYEKVTATRGKILRAEPISAMYEQGRVHHIGLHKDLEDQMCNYTGLPGSKSPDRLDAVVWALTKLSENKNGGFLNFVDQYNLEKKMAEDAAKAEKEKQPNAAVSPWGF